MLRRLILPMAAATVLCLTAAPVLADALERVPPVTHPATVKECGECHMAFQPGLLPAQSWNRIMDGLADHFGSDASLPADAVADIRAYLTANAGWKGDGTLMRITDQFWFLDEHHNRRPGTRARSFADCQACHRDAGHGLYDDD